VEEARRMATAIDPVCGMEVDAERAQLTSDYEGVTYYFCSRGCKLDFDEDPARYLDPGYQPSM
jgi:YHS domain-containing protein